MAGYVSSQDGYWDEAATWGGGGVPGDGDTVTITHDVQIRGNVTVGTDAGTAITLSGTLRWIDNPSGDYTLLIKGDTIVNSGIFQVGTESVPVPSNRIATVEFGGTGEWKLELQSDGLLRLHGYPSYHMASSLRQRTRMAQDVVAGTSQIVMDDSVDWQAGDVLWLGTGGDPENSATGPEKVTINTKVSSTTYNIVGVLANNHYDGDLVIHATRNVILKGQGVAQGFRIYTASIDGQFDIAWARWEYGGTGSTQHYAAIGFAHFSNSEHIDVGQVKLKNCVFDEPGDSNARAIFFYYAPHEWSEQWFTDISENHIWGFETGVETDSLRGRLAIGHVSVFNHQGRAIDCSGNASTEIRGLWTVGKTSLDSGVYTYYGPPATIIKDFKIHHTYRGIYCGTGGSGYYTGTASGYIDGEMYHIRGSSTYSYGLYAMSSQDVGNLNVRNVYFRDIQADGVQLPRAPRAYFYNCTFNKCDRYAVYGISNPGRTDMRFIDCDFGTVEQNGSRNIYMATPYDAHGRFIAEKCTFKEPASFSVSYDWTNEILEWAMDTYQIYDWRQRANISYDMTLEYIDCIIQDSTGADQWGINFPNTTRLGLLPGGSEIHKTHPTNESSGYIDGTFQRKLLPFMGTGRIDITRVYPLRIPVLANQTITIGLSFKKNISQESGTRPKLHMVGCGIYDEEEMSDVIDTWEELSVSGTADVDGVVEVWVSCWGVQDYHTGAPARTPTTDYNFAYPIDPGGTGTGVGTPNNLILYCDKFVRSVSDVTLQGL